MILSKKITALSFLVLAAALLVFGSSLVVAQEAETTEAEQEVTTMEATPLMQEATEMTTQGNQRRGRSAERSARLEEYKATLEEKLSAAEERRLTARCKSAQTKVATLSQNAATVVENRQAVITGVVERFRSLISQIEAAGLDASALSTAVDELVAMNDAFAVQASDYQQSLADVAEMDCEADPEAFKAALKQARTDRVALFQSAKGMRTYIQETIKPILTDLRESLAGDDSTEEATEGEQ